MSKLREQQLEQALVRLLGALDNQHWQRTPPGAYHYSPNVTEAMGNARRLVTPKAPRPEPPSEDVGGPSV
jgi:hypothetical protein